MKKSIKEIKDNKSKNGRNGRPGNPRPTAFFFTVLFIIAVCTCVASAVSPKSFELSVGDVAPETITAPHDVINEDATKELRQQARDSVAMAYSQDPVPTAKSITDLEKFFSGVIQMRADAVGFENAKVDEYRKHNSQAATQKYQEQYKWLDELTDQEMSVLKADVLLQLYDDEVISLIKASKSDIERLHTV
ncbi:MAG: hypothetical protein Q8O09_00770, partial [Bacillota bacterium]|nr:hypothetical protein [Bacillota bacterium]